MLFLKSRFFLCFTLIYLPLCFVHSQEEASCLTLRQAVEIALLNNRLLVSSYNALNNANITTRQRGTIFNLGVIPRGETGFSGGGNLGNGFMIGGGVCIDKLFPCGASVSVNPSAIMIGKEYHTALKCKISQPLLKGFGEDYTRSGFYAAEYDARTACRNLQKAISFTILRTIEAVYEIAKQREILILTQQSFQRLTSFVKLTKIKEQIGISDGLDVYRAEIELKHAEEAMNVAETRLQEAKDFLCEILNLSNCTEVDVCVYLQHFETCYDLQQGIEAAIAQRIEVEQSLDAFYESKRHLKIAKKNLQPAFNVVLDYTNSGWDESFTRSFATPSRENRWGIGLQTSLLNSSNEEAEYEKAVVAVETAAAAFEEIKNVISLEVKQHFLALQQARKRIVILHTQIANAEGELNLAKVKFLRGMANNFDVVHAEMSLRNAQTHLISAIIDHRIGEYRFYHSLGLLNETILSTCQDAS
jgi:outer membrane protein TolC